jgi:uncharacterized protein (DUF302 family)
MAILQITIERLSLVSSRPFEAVVAALEAVVGHPDMPTFARSVEAAGSWQEFEQVIHGAIGPSGFMEFIRFNHGEMLRKEQGSSAPRILRVVVGNPLIMKQMADHVSDAGSYAPVTILIDERQDGVHLSYDRMSSYLAPYGNSAAIKVAGQLDAKIEALLRAAAG